MADLDLDELELVYGQHALVPALIAEVRRLRDRLDAVTTERDEARADRDGFDQERCRVVMEELEPALAASAHWKALEKRLRAALSELHAWADGYVHPKTGMGAGLHQEMWPALTPSAATELLRRTEAVLAETAPERGEEGQ